MWQEIPGVKYPVSNTPSNISPAYSPGDLNSLPGDPATAANIPTHQNIEKSVIKLNLDDSDLHSFLLTIFCIYQDVSTT